MSERSDTVARSTQVASTTQQREAFIAELDGVADVLRSQQPAHDRHQGWSLRSDGALLCSCGRELYPSFPGAAATAQPRTRPGP